MHTIESFIYDFSKRALEKWERNRLTIVKSNSGFTVSFNIKGSTCSNMGWPIIFTINMDLVSTAKDYTLENASINFTEDIGYKKMCYFQTDSPLQSVLKKAPFLEGESLNKIISKLRNQQPSGCLCTNNGRNYFWNIAMQTIHYHLNNNAKDKIL